MTVCSSRGLLYGCLYCLLSVSTKQQRLSGSAAIVLQLNKHSQRAKVLLLEMSGLCKTLLSWSLMQGYVWNRLKGRDLCLMAEGVSSLSKFPGVFAKELNGRKIALSLCIQPHYSTQAWEMRSSQQNHWRQEKSWPQLHSEMLEWEHWQSILELFSADLYCVCLHVYANLQKLWKAFLWFPVMIPSQRVYLDE